MSENLAPRWADLIEQPPLLLQEGYFGIEHRFGQTEVEIGRRASLAAYLHLGLAEPVLDPEVPFREHQRRLFD